MRNMRVINCDRENNMNERGRGFCNRSKYLHLATTFHFLNLLSNEANYCDSYLCEMRILFIVWYKMYVVTIYVPTTALIFRYNDIQFAVNLQYVPPFFGHIQGGSQQKKKIHQWLVIT
jgi:hypothetical protein